MLQVPSLKSTLVFEVVVWRLTIKDAADELHAKPTVINHLINNVEEHLGASSFHRLPRSLR